MGKLASWLSLVLVCLLALSAQAQVAVISGQAINQYGQPLPNALIRVCSVTSTGVPCTPTVSIYQDYGLTIPAPNPWTTDQYGNYTLYVGPIASPNLYTIQQSPASGITWSYVFNGPSVIKYSSGPVNSIQASDGNGGFISDASVLLNTTTHTVTTPNLALSTSGNSVLLQGQTGTSAWTFQLPTTVPSAMGECLTATPTGSVAATQWSTNCGVSTNPGFDDSLAVAAAAGDTTLTIASSFRNYPAPGYLYIDSEWINYASIVGNTVTVATNGRGYYGTTAASHSLGATVVGCAVCISASTVLPFAPVVGDEGSGQQVMGVKNSFPSSYNGQAALVVSSGSQAFVVDNAGVVHQFATSTPVRIVRGNLSTTTQGNEFAAPVFIGANSTQPIYDSTYVAQTNVSQQYEPAQGFAGGIAGPVTTLQPPTIAAPFVLPVFNSGASTWSYVCQGIDVDSNLIPGSTGTITNGAATLTFPANMTVYCPQAAGAQSFKVYRTAGGPNIGLVGTATIPYGYIQDFGGTLDGSSPSGTNTDIPRICNNNSQYCLLSGTSSTPPIACGSAQSGWEYHIAGATSSPFTLRCVSGAWVNAAQGTSGATGNYAYPVSITTGNGLVTSVTAGSAPHVIQTMQITSGICTTPSSAAGYSCTSPASGSFTWGTAFSSSNYSLTCTGTQPNGTSQVALYLYWINKTATGFQLVLQNGIATSGGPGTFNEIDCTGIL